MAEKRMFAKSIVLSDAFTDMPLSARCLYFTLGMVADDAGFVGNPKSIMRQCGASQDDMTILLTKRFILGFESGVIVIKHWLINNYLRNDRVHPTTYVEEKNTLELDNKGAYTEKEKSKNCLGIPTVNQMSTTCLPTGIPSIDKYSIDKISIEERECAGAHTHTHAHTREKYGKYKNIELSENDIEELKKEFPESWEYRINELSEAVAAKNYPVYNALATIRRWANNTIAKEKEKLDPELEQKRRMEKYIQMTKEYDS